MLFLCFCMIFDVFAWYLMFLHDIWCFCMILHVFAWYLMLLHDIAWYLVFHAYLHVSVAHCCSNSFKCSQKTWEHWSHEAQLVFTMAWASQPALTRASRGACQSAEKKQKCVLLICFYSWLQIHKYDIHIALDSPKCTYIAAKHVLNPKMHVQAAKHV